MSSLHANCILINTKALLIKGASGTGKSLLCWQLLQENSLFTRLVADDRTLVSKHNARLIATCPKEIQGKIELRHHGIINVAFEHQAQIGAVIELGVANALRMPLQTTTEISGITLPFYQFPPNFEGLTFIKALINLDLLK